jgi:hypothetical protein
VTYVVAALNVPAGRFGEIPAGTYDGARFVARRLSKQEQGVSFGAYQIADGEGSVLLASFLNGERTFTAEPPTPTPDGQPAV